ncbi:MAG: SsrA-binding protein SmpB [Betaproteobacteria bacterium]|jgi:SsrA-binding protein|nr:SsrA-binding protein SmpB [Candidatus Binatia bacterium]
MANKQPSSDEKIVCLNRQARHNYFIDEIYEAGLVLVGSEVKSLRDGKANLVDSYAQIRHGEAFLINAHISPYAGANQFNHEPTRIRKLLLHGREIERLTGKTKERGLTLIPLKLYFKGGRAKVELGLARGKKLYDKRETLRRKVAEREVERSLKSRH